MEWESRLSTIMKQVGFRKSLRLDAEEHLDPSDRKRLHFLVMHSSKNKDLIYKITKLVRSSREDNIRFMPIIVLLDTSKESAVQEFLNLGCDDILIYPCSAKVIAHRLKQQVRKPRDFYETEQYFGPDRRIHAPNQEHPDRRNGEGSTYKHIVIERSVDGGIKIISTTQHAPQEDQIAS